MNCKNKIVVTEDYLHVNCVSGLIDCEFETVLFNNESHDYELLMAFLKENNQSIVAQVYLITNTNHNYHCELMDYLTKMNVEVFVNNSLGTEKTKKVVKRYKTENLNTRTLNNRLDFLKRVIVREEKRLADLIYMDKSKFIIDMLLKSISDYKKKQRVLEIILNGRS